MKVKIEEDMCIGCGACCAIAPEIFEFSDEGYATNVGDKDDEGFTYVDDEDEEIVVEAHDGCPTGAVKIDK